MPEMVLEFQPLGRRVVAHQGETILQAAHRGGVPIVSICAGRGTCGRCRVRVVQDGNVSPPSLLEKAYLGERELAAGFRLACQAQPMGSLKLFVPPESLEGERRLQVAGNEREVALDPMVRAFALALQPPQFGDDLADAERLLAAFRQEHSLKDLSLDFAALKALPQLLRDGDWRGKAFVWGDSEVIGWGGLNDPPLGVALDLGTTKMAFYLVDLATGKTLVQEGAMNPQLLHGEDLMARIAYASQELQGGKVLQGLVVDTANRVVERLCRMQGASPSQVGELVMVGNTAMHHLFVGLPVAQLGVAPYVPAVSAALDIKARDLGLELAPGARVHTLPNVAGFVGADHVAMILASELDSARGVVLGLDIGTNTEVVLVREGEMASCSCASGPAFEGGHILYGMRAATGAIERVRLEDGKLVVDTIGDAPAVGICGSGILDAVAVLYQGGAINYRGRMDAAHPWVRQGERGPEVVLVEKEASGTGEDIVIIQEDINQIQLAKGAIRTGIDTLLRVMEVEESLVERVVIAGAFGSYIRTQAALAIGMFPAFSKATFERVGNAAGVGAKLALVSRRERARAQEFASRIRHIELQSQPDFMEHFALAMYLPR